MSDYNQYETVVEDSFDSNNEVASYDDNLVVDPTQAIVSDVPVESVVEEQSYEIKDSDEILAARDMANAVNYDLIILIVLVVALVGGAIFFFLKQNQGHQQVPTSDPEEQKVEESEQPSQAEEEVVVETKE